MTRLHAVILSERLNMYQLNAEVLLIILLPKGWITKPANLLLFAALLFSHAVNDCVTLNEV